jgi:hypothetical protein
VLKVSGLMFELGKRDGCEMQRVCATRYSMQNTPRTIVRKDGMTAAVLTIAYLGYTQCMEQLETCAADTFY